MTRLLKSVTLTDAPFDHVAIPALAAATFDVVPWFLAMLVLRAVSDAAKLEAVTRALPESA